MKISEFLAEVQQFTDYIQSLGNTPTKWDFILGVYGVVPCLWPHGKMSRIFNPMQAIVAGWDGCHDMSLWHIRPSEEQVCAALGFSQKRYDLVDAALHRPRSGYNATLRADILTACGLEE